MKPDAIRELTDEELHHQFDEVRRELFNLRVQKSTGQLENPARLRVLRREVARIKTILNQRENAPQ
jgi:large subunit ribosomal protein L29